MTGNGMWTVNVFKTFYMLPRDFFVMYDNTSYQSDGNKKATKIYKTSVVITYNIVVI